VNIVRTVTRKSSYRLKFCWLKVICCISQSNELEHGIKQKTGKAKEGASQKSVRGHGPPRPPLRTSTVPLSFLSDVRYSTMEKLS